MTSDFGHVFKNNLVHQLMAYTKQYKETIDYNVIITYFGFT